jgi:hypothetical protein
MSLADFPELTRGPHPEVTRTNRNDAGISTRDDRFPRTNPKMRDLGNAGELPSSPRTNRSLARPLIRRIPERTGTRPARRPSPNEPKLMTPQIPEMRRSGAATQKIRARTGPGPVESNFPERTERRPEASSPNEPKSIVVFG